MLAYGLKLYFEDGDWAYVKVGSDSTSGYLTKDERLIKPFMDLDEVRNYYQQIKKYSFSYEGRIVNLQYSRCSAIRINY